MDDKVTDAVAACEEVLRKEQAFNLEHNMLRSENIVIVRLLDRRLELSEAYAELHAKLSARPFALKTFFDAVITTTAFWNPEEIEQARSGRQRLRKVNSLIASKAAELAALLDERSELHTHSGFAGDTIYSACGLIDAAGESNYLFRSWVQRDLADLRGQFDLKYWPSLGECMATLAHDAENAELEPTDPITAAATDAKRPSLADFFKALFEAIDTRSTGLSSSLPPELKVTDNSLASLANCALDLGPDDLVDGAYVKRLRQRERERAVAQASEAAPL